LIRKLNCFFDGVERLEERSLGKICGEIVLSEFRGFVERSLRLVMNKYFFILEYSLPVKIFFIRFTA
jgi:hypothetical protein